MSEKKGEVEGDSKKTDDRKEVDDKKSKAKKETPTKKAKHNNVTEENNEESKEADSSENESPKATKSKKASKKSKENQEEEFDDDVKVKKKIPLLDQPPIIEGSRVRSCVVEAKNKAVIVPRGKGKTLGQIPLVNQRLKRLRIPTMKVLHRLIYGRIGKINLVLSNLQKFKGFEFLEDSDDYSKKLAALNKLHMDQLKELIFSFDLDMKLKKKDECIKQILNFLISPKTSDKPQNPTFSHPKRKATKRNYFDGDVEAEETKKRKKTKSTAESKKEKASENDESAETSAKSSKTNDKSINDTAAKNDEDQDSSNELKKPAKKRKRNQIIDEEESKKDAEVEDDDDEEASLTNDSQSSAKKSSSDKDKLSDEELKIFLKKVLADLNLENTTMKTVYNLITSEYPTYDYSKKKRFIKGVVKSLIQ